MKKKYTFTLDPVTHDSFKAYCKKDDKKMSTMIERLMSNFLKYGKGS